MFVHTAITTLRCSYCHPTFNEFFEFFSLFVYYIVYSTCYILLFYSFFHPDLTNKQKSMTISFQTILPASLWGWDGNNCHLLISFEAPELGGWKSSLTRFETTGLDIHVTHTIDSILFCN